MKIIKRNGAEEFFDVDKILMAVTKANEAVEEKVRMTPLQIQRISRSVEIACEEMGRSPSVEEIQDLVEKAIMAHGAFEVAKEYITYRYIRSLARQSNTTDDRILSLIECNNEEVKQENANKNPTINAVQRDYMAGEISKDITKRILLPQDIVAAHEAGIIHFHDSDYYAQHMHNCDLVNLEDMLQNGTVISGTLIEKPHSFSTACNIATQIIAQVASNQYGGQSISLTHLAPFVQVSREKIRIYATFQSEEEAKNFISYLKTKTFRALVWACRIEQHLPNKTYRFVPLQDFSKPWTDAELYAKYELTEEEIAFIESMIKPMD